MREYHCVMLGLGGPTFITDWAKAVARFSRVTGLSVLPTLPRQAERIGKGIALGDVGGFTTVFVRRRRLRPVRLFWKWNAGREAAAIRRALTLLNWDPDIIHGHFYAGAAAIPSVARQLQIPFVLTEHTSRLAAPDPEHHLSREGIRIMKLVFAEAAAVFFVGEEQKESACRLGATGTFDVIPNPVDTSLFHPKPLPSTGGRIVTIGHLLTRKRHDLLIAALQHVVARYPDTHLDIIGGGDQRASLERLASELGLASAITFHGQTKRETIADLLQDAVLYVHTSERESFGVAIVEALLSGTPAVTIRCGGVSEELAAHVGIAFDDPSAVAVAEAIIKGFETDEFAAPAVISRWASERYGTEAVAAAVQKHYDRIVHVP